MGYCEFKIPFLIEGVKAKTAQMAIGSVLHDELERIERASVVQVPLTVEKLQDVKSDLDFIREDVATLFTHEFDLASGKSRLSLFGRADKVFRQDTVLVISDDKHTAKPSRHDSLSSPYNDQLLQVLAYLHSEYNLGDAVGGICSIPHERKMYKINIIDSRTKSVYKTYQEYVTESHTGMFLEYAARFVEKCLKLDELQHHNSKFRCKACGYFGDCANALR